MNTILIGTTSTGINCDVIVVMSFGCSNVCVDVSYIMVSFTLVMIGTLCARNIIHCYMITNFNTALNFSFNKGDILLTYYNISVEDICNFG